MPKRTNDFQRIIHHVYRQVSPSGAKVTESAMIKNMDGTITREVDVLIEHSVSGVDIRIAIECRDTGRKNDLQWIDALIGKYHDMPVDKIVAVSRNGFSENARKKASANRIVALSMDEALKINWTEQIMRARLIEGNTVYRMLGYSLHCDPEWKAGEIPDLCFSHDGTSSLAFREFLLSILEHLKESKAPLEAIQDKYGSYLDTVTPYTVTCHWEGLDNEISSNSGSRYRLKRLTFQVEVSFEMGETLHTTELREGEAVIWSGIDISAKEKGFTATKIYTDPFEE